ncbi:MAG: DUF599 domain-containing protein [Betaproteobacteria bacterium]|nr:DUF599 domain-containing protein [Betaproteobacteria bacterium]
MTIFEPWIREFGVDLLAMAFSAVLIAAYYLSLRRRSKRDPTLTIHGLNELARAHWVAGVMANSGKDVMAVQTLRNFVMGASLMATTAAFLILGTLTLSGQAENIAHSWHAVNLAGSSSAGLWVAKVVLLLADFIVAFFAFAMAIRLANHVVFMINVPGPAPHPLLAPEQVARRLNLAGAHFATGMRAFFFAVPLVFWLFGPALLAMATLGLVFALYRLDRNPAA